MSLVQDEEDQGFSFWLFPDGHRLMRKTTAAHQDTQPVKDFFALDAACQHMRALIEYLESLHWDMTNYLLRR